MNDTLILYTYRLRGQVSLLPQLFTFLRDLRRTYAAETTVILDLGDACVPDAWHCAATDGRSMLIVMDAMGYHAANVTGYLSSEGRAKLDGMMTLELMNEGQPFTTAQGLRIELTPAENTALQEDGRLRLARVEAGQVGVVRLVDEFIACEIQDMPPKTAPDATIAGIVDFVLSEAKYYRGKRGEG
jgi:hypothetical protein